MEDKPQRLQLLLKRLGNALHGSMVNSKEVRACLRELHQEGWMAVMMLEASVACRREDGDPEVDKASLHVHVDQPRTNSFRFSHADIRLLHSLGISPGRAPLRCSSTGEPESRE